MQKSNKAKIILWISLGVLVLGGLFIYPKLTDPSREVVKKWRAAGIECINGHSNLSQHIHLNLTVIVDGEKEILPHDIGIAKSCMAEIHTHDYSGTIHVESVSASKEFTLGQFFAVWNRSLERPGYEEKVFVDGAVSEDGANLILKDGQKIVAEYNGNG